MSKPIHPTLSTAFYAQAVLAFAISLGSVVIALAFLPADAWVRAFLAIGIVFLVSSTFTLAKVIRDRQELSVVANRVDQARLDKLLTEHDPFKVEG
ncbi:MAG: hypothetical protein HOY71_12180 [Nonomuraea sp.]|nr:hypothetical protein [Nonomuraea sp.]